MHLNVCVCLSECCVHTAFRTERLLVFGQRCSLSALHNRANVNAHTSSLTHVYIAQAQIWASELHQRPPRLTITCFTKGPHRVPHRAYRESNVVKSIYGHICTSMPIYTHMCHGCIYDYIWLYMSKNMYCILDVWTCFGTSGLVFCVSGLVF